MGREKKAVRRGAVATLDTAQARMVDGANDAIFVRDWDDRLRYWNQGAVRLYQWTRAEALGQVSQTLLHTRFPVALAVILQELTQAGTWVGELEQQRKDGGWVKVSSRWMLEAGTAGEANTILEINTDITEQARAQQARRESEARFRGLLEASPDAIVIVGRDGRIVLANRRLEAMFGYPAAELLGQPVELLVPARLAARHRMDRQSYECDPVTRAMGAGLNLMAVCRDGREFPVEISLSPLRAGEDLLVTAVIRDITQRKRAEADLLRLHTLQLAETEHLATLGQIATGLAHEIKNPLAGIAGALEVVAGHSNNPEDKEVIEEVRQQVGRIRDTITDLLNYARPRPLQLRAGDLNATVEQVVHFAAHQAEAGGIELRFHGGVLPPVVHDADSIHRMVLNLVLNALDAVTGAGTVSMTTTLAPGPPAEACIAIADSGSGIAAHELEHIFRPFYTTKGGQGNGLGLPLCQRIAALHGGRIEVQSAPGQGSCFTAVLPLAPPGVEAAR